MRHSLGLVLRDLHSIAGVEADAVLGPDELDGRRSTVDGATRQLNPTADTMRVRLMLLLLLMLLAFGRPGHRQFCVGSPG